MGCHVMVKSPLTMIGVAHTQGFKGGFFIPTIMQAWVRFAKCYLKWIQVLSLPWWDLNYLPVECYYDQINVLWDENCGMLHPSCLLAFLFPNACFLLTKFRLYFNWTLFLTWYSMWPASKSNSSAGHLFLDCSQLPLCTFCYFSENPIR